MKEFTQPSLYGPTPDFRPRSHANDPATSHEAARKHVESGHYATNIEIVLALVREFPRKTANELFRLASPERQVKLCDAYEVRRRLTDLADGPEPMIRRTEVRACTIKTTKMSTWEAR